jgi:ribosome-associated protein
MMEPLIISPTLAIPPADLSWDATRASGPGGQNVNKVASKIELRFDLAGCRVLDDETRRRLRALAGSRVDTDGQLHIVSQLTRDQGRNLQDAREKLRLLILRALERPKPRRPTRPTRASKERRLVEKRQQGERKKGRRPDSFD